MKNAREVADRVRSTVFTLGSYEQQMVPAVSAIEAYASEEYQRGRRGALEEAARTVEEHQEHMDFAPAQNHRAEPGDPYRCCVAEAVRALKGVDREGATDEPR